MVARRVGYSCLPAASMVWAARKIRRESNRGQTTVFRIVLFKDQKPWSVPYCFWGNAREPSTQNMRAESPPHPHRRAAITFSKWLKIQFPKRGPSAFRNLPPKYRSGSGNLRLRAQLARKVCERLDWKRQGNSRKPARAKP